MVRVSVVVRYGLGLGLGLKFEPNNLHNLT